MKKLLKTFSITICLIIAILIALFGVVCLAQIIDKKFMNSIPMPEILGKFQEYENYIEIWGLESIVDDEIASLGYAELFCNYQTKNCYENRVAITNLQGVYIFPYNNEYYIKYRDKNKIVLSNDIDTVTGEIDLINKTLSYSTKSKLDNSARKIEIITDNKKIYELEKKIIKKHLRK